MPQVDVPELSITLWSDLASAHDQLTAQIHALAPDARIALGSTQNQLQVILAEADALTVAALETLLQHDFEASVFSCRWYARAQQHRHHQLA